MDSKKKELIERFLELHNATCEFDDEENLVEIEHFSSLGEDFVFTIEADGFSKHLREYYDGFDAESHAVDNWNSTHLNLQNLLDDALEIDEWLEELAEDFEAKFEQIGKSL